MRKVMKYKLYYLISNKFVTISAIFLIIALNFQALLNSGILLSGGSSFNGLLKYELMLNNYLLIASVYGLLFSIYLGSSIIGPDMQTGNIQVILTSCSSRPKYYLGTFFAVFIFMTAIQFVMLINIIALFLVFDAPLIWKEVFSCFVQNLLNGVIVLSITGLASIYMKGHSSAVVGLLCYTYFNIYMYNTIPFINTSFVFDVTRYRDILCNFIPIVHILPSSYTPANVTEAYSMRPMISNVSVYQALYGFVIVSLGTLCFRYKEL